MLIYDPCEVWTAHAGGSCNVKWQTRQIVNSSPCLAKGIFVVLGSLSSMSKESSMSVRAQFWAIDLALDTKGGLASFC
jgi:hypothetical protein